MISLVNFGPNDAVLTAASGTLGALLPTFAIVIALSYWLLKAIFTWVRAVATLVGAYTLAVCTIPLFSTGPVWELADAVWLSLIASLFCVGGVALLDIVLGPPRVRGIWAVVRDARMRLRRLRRYATISRIAAKHGVLGYLRGRRPLQPETVNEVGRSIALALEESGTTFIKLGQVLASRDELLPPALRREMIRLHDQVKPVPFADIEGVIRRELGDAATEVLAGLNPEPLATASVAQVHAGVLRGEPIVVKVQKPGIDAAIDDDLDILARFAASLERQAAWARRLRVTEIVAAFAAALREELDFRIEAANVRQIRGVTGGGSGSGAESPMVAIVNVHDEYSGKFVLLMSQVPGAPLAQGAMHLSHARRYDLANALLEELLRQIFDLGVFHADPHPGNFYLTPDQRIVMLDFGSVGRADPQTRTAIVNALVAVSKQDALALTDAVLQLSTNPGAVDRTALHSSLRSYVRTHLMDAQALDASAVSGLFSVAATHGLELAPDLGGVLRAVGVMDGTLTSLAPEFNALEQATALMQARVVAAFTPSGVKDFVTHEAHTLLPLLRRLPGRVDALLDQIQYGKLNVNARLFAHPDDRRFIREILLHLVMTVMIITGAGLGVALLALNNGPMTGFGVPLWHVIAWVLVGAASLTLLSLVTKLHRNLRR